MDAHPDRGGSARVIPATPAQIVAVALVVAALGGSLWLARERPATAEVPLLDDTTLTAAQLAKVEAALDRAGLTAYRAESGRVWVPRAKQSAYKRAVVDADAIPRPWGTRFHDAIREGGVWASPAARAESLRVARQDELALVLSSMPGIERASVMVDEEPRAGFQQEPLKTASVGIHAAAGSPLDAERARAVRVLVASSVAGLEPERVAVTDLSTGRVFAGALDAGASPLDALLARTSALEAGIAARARQALGGVPGAFVSVSIGAARSLDDEAHAQTPRRDAAANAPAEVPVPAGRGAAGPAVIDALSLLEGRLIDVTVSVPEPHLAATKGRGPAGEGWPDGDAGMSVAAGESERLRGLVTRALSPLASSTSIRVHVTAHPVSGDFPGVVAVAVDPPVAETVAGDSAARQVDATGPEPLTMPREGWLAVTSVLVGLLAGVTWWAGTRDRAAIANDVDDIDGAGERRRAA